MPVIDPTLQAHAIALARQQLLTPPSVQPAFPVWPGSAQSDTPETVLAKTVTTQTLPSPATQDAETATELREAGTDVDTQADLGSELAYWLWVRNLGDAPLELKRWLKLILPKEMRGCKCAGSYRPTS